MHKRIPVGAHSARKHAIEQHDRGNVPIYGDGDWRDADAFSDKSSTAAESFTRLVPRVLLLVPLSTHRTYGVLVLHPHLTTPPAYYTSLITTADFWLSS
jgi:hypothetical protein